MRYRAIAILGAAGLALGLLVSIAPAGSASTGTLDSRLDTRAEALAWIKTHGYLPLNGLDRLAATKAAAGRWAAAHGSQATSSAGGGAAPIIGSSWQGVSQANVSPADPNGAIGPNSYLEIINQMLGIYNRAGGLITSASLITLTGHVSVSDPMILWDPDTQRFYYNVWDTSAGTMEWGFSKDNNPTSIPGSFCNYTASFGYTSAELPDYPKLGQTKDFLLIGVNHYTSPNFNHADRTDVLWINKPQGQNPVTTCPASGTFGTGIFKDLRNQDNTIAFTPVPVIQTDPSSTSFVVSMSDIECPDICGSGTLITVHAVRPSPTNPLIPQLKVKGSSVRVGAFMPPDDAPQKGSTDVLDSLDGRLTHATSGIDPSRGNRLALWTAHSVVGGAGAMISWYEINPLPIKHPSLFQSGTVSDPNLWIINPGISSDRTCTATQCAHGDAMVVGFTTTGVNAFPASQMVSKIGAGGQSGLVLVKQSTTFDNDFTCTPVCRWGDYGGATSDPAASLVAAQGEVWLTNQWTDGTNETWNWEAKP